MLVIEVLKAFLFVFPNFYFDRKMPRHTIVELSLGLGRLDRGRNIDLDGGERKQSHRKQEEDLRQYAEVFQGAMTSCMRVQQLYVCSVVLSIIRWPRGGYNFLQFDANDPAA